MELVQLGPSHEKLDRDPVNHVPSDYALNNLSVDSNISSTYEISEYDIKFL